MAHLRNNFLLRIKMSITEVYKPKYFLNLYSKNSNLYIKKLYITSRKITLLIDSIFDTEIYIYHCLLLFVQLMHAPPVYLFKITTECKLSKM